MEIVDTTESIGTDSEKAKWKHSSADVLDFLKESRDSFSLRGVRGSALAYLVAEAMRSMRKPFLLVAATDREVEKLAEDVAFFWGRSRARSEGPLNRQVFSFPSRGANRAQSLGKMETTARRMEALYAIKTAPSPLLVATSVRALLERLPPAETFLAHTSYKVVGDEVDPEALCRQLGERGYFGVPLVEEYGDMSRRGGVLDVFTPLYKWPVRMEFFGEEIESLRLFHPSSQRSLGAIEDVVILPASEILLDSEARERAQKAVYEDVRRERLSPTAGNAWLERLQEGMQTSAFEDVLPVFYERTMGLLDYLAPETVVVWSDVASIERELDEQGVALFSEPEGGLSPLQHEWRRPASELFASPERLRQDVQNFQQAWVNPITPKEASRREFDLAVSGHENLALSVKSHAGRERMLEPLADQFAEWRREGVHVFLSCSRQEQGKRLAMLLENYGIDAVFSAFGFGEESYDAPAAKVIVSPLASGFYWEAERLAIVCEEEVLGKRRPARRHRKSISGLFLSSFQDLHIDDCVVHVDHGIGVYKGLMHLDVRGGGSDFLLLEYQDGDKLYVPVDRLQKVQKYLGVEGQSPPIDKLGGKSWETAKKKAKESTQAIAKELLRLYAERQVRQGFRFTPPDNYFKEFEATFAYEETPDQLQAIEDVLDDMTSERPMDRLICGDVGYGKTEVALRAAFKAIMDGKQVAMLAPTTVLAEQHYQTFRERFQSFPVRVGVLSRLKTAAQQRQVLEGLEKGLIDMVIGTHRLLQKDITFRNLGLLVIDEEHRFGVKDKERLKHFRASVDVLTLTATPIPRTLHMSLSGIRDLSTIETPPQDRKAIETYVCKYEPAAVRDAIRRELKRSGQVFFVHNHVQTIYATALQLGELVPEARIAVGHGQMKDRELEKVMLDFINRDIDVLVCTTIIESGLDIPAANTIIINRADKFGLAQIYQLRGRVGRAHEQAYAYLFIPDENLISRDAQKRLRALMDFSELGSGFKIALNDLQIRGGGAILGAAQSGHITAVGYELYLELLESTVRQMKGEGVKEEAIEPEINIPAAAFLPEDFIPDADQRLLAYKRLSAAADDSEIDDLAGEWRDRYGLLPENAKNLVLLSKIRVLLRDLWIFRVDAEELNFSLHFAPQANLNALLSFFKANKRVFFLEPERKLIVESGGKRMARRLVQLKRILRELWEESNKASELSGL
jgi:transcription-repair coupling factor (superfamily II helicase)